MNKIGVAVVTVAVIVVALTLMLCKRGGMFKSNDSSMSADRQLSKDEIYEVLRTIPEAGWHEAQVIEGRLHEQDRALVRQAALEVLAAVKSPPIDDYWTLRSLAELVGHPIPDEMAESIIQHFKRMGKNREMLGPTLVLIGTEEAAKVLITAEEEEGRYFSRIDYPLEDAVRHGWLYSGFCETLSSHLAERAEKNAKQFAEDNLGHFWLLVDPPKAVERLTQEPFWTPEFDAHWDVLRCLVKNAAKVSEERLWAFDDLVKRRSATNENTVYPNPDIVWLLARIHSDRVDAHIETLKQNPDFVDRALAAEAALQGVIQPRLVVYRHLEDPGYFNSPAPIRHLWAMELLGMELVNGGIHQYLFNSSGDLWPDALEGLEKAGYSRPAEALKSAIALFGPEGPSTNREIRWKQLDRLSKAAEAKLDQFGDEVYEGMTETNTWPYIMRNAEVFRTEPPRQGSL